MEKKKQDKNADKPNLAGIDAMDSLILGLQIVLGLALPLFVTWLTSEYSIWSRSFWVDIGSKITTMSWAELVIIAAYWIGVAFSGWSLSNDTWPSTLIACAAWYMIVELANALAAPVDYPTFSKWLRVSAPDHSTAPVLWTLAWVSLILVVLRQWSAVTKN